MEFIGAHDVKIIKFINTFLLSKQTCYYAALLVLTYTDIILLYLNHLYSKQHNTVHCTKTLRYRKYFLHLLLKKINSEISQSSKLFPRPVVLLYCSMFFEIILKTMYFVLKKSLVHPITPSKKCVKNTN